MGRPRRVRVAVWAWICALGVTFGVASASGEPDARSQTDALFQAGREAMKRGEYALACKHFSESQELAPALGSLLNLALCEEKLGRLLDARTKLEQLLDDPKLDEQRRAIALQYSAELNARIPQLSIRRRSDSATPSTITVDGQPTADRDANGWIPVDPGPHRVLFQSPGQQERQVSITLRERDRVVVIEPAVAPEPLPRTPLQRPQTAGTNAQPRAPVAPKTSESTPIAGYVIGGAGVVGLITGAVAGLLALEQKSVVEAHCNGTQCDSAEAVEAGKKTVRLANVSATAFAVGIVGVGVGGYLILTATPPVQTARSAQTRTELGASLFIGF